MSRLKTVFLWVKVAAIVALVLGLIAYVTLLPMVAERTVLRILRSSGLATGNLRINVISPTCLQITNFKTGPDEMVRVGSLTVDYSPASLFHGRVNHVGIEGLEFTARIRDGKVEYGSLGGLIKPAAAPSTGSPASAPASKLPALSIPFDSVELRSSAFILDYEGYKVRIPIRVQADYVASAGTVGGDLKIDSVIEPLTLPVHLASTCDTNTWTCTTDADITVGTPPESVASASTPATQPTGFNRIASGGHSFFQLAFKHELEDGHWKGNLTLKSHAAGAAIGRDGSLKVLDPRLPDSANTAVPMAAASGCDADLHASFDDRLKIIDIGGNVRIESIAAAPLKVSVIQIGLAQTPSRWSVSAGMFVDHPRFWSVFKSRIELPKDLSLFLAPAASGGGVVAARPAVVDIKATTEAGIRGGAASWLELAGIVVPDDGISVGANLDATVTLHPREPDWAGPADWRVDLHQGLPESAVKGPRYAASRLGDQGNGLSIKIPMATQIISGIGVDHCIIELLGVHGSITPRQLDLTVPGDRLRIASEFRLPFETDIGLHHPHHFARIDSSAQGISVSWKDWMKSDPATLGVHVPDIDIHVDHDETFDDLSKTGLWPTHSALSPGGGLKIQDIAALFRLSMDVKDQQFELRMLDGSLVQASADLVDPVQKTEWKTGEYRLMLGSIDANPLLRFDLGGKRPTELAIRAFAARAMTGSGPKIDAGIESLECDLAGSRGSDGHATARAHVTLDAGNARTEPVATDVGHVTLDADVDAPAGQAMTLRLTTRFEGVGAKASMATVSVPSGSIGAKVVMQPDQSLNADLSFGLVNPSVLAMGYAIGAQAVNLNCTVNRTKTQDVHAVQKLAFTSPTVTSKDLSVAFESIGLAGQVDYSVTAPLTYQEVVLATGGHVSHPSSTAAVSDILIEVPITQGVTDKSEGRIQLGMIHYKGQDLMPVKGTLSMHDKKVAATLAADLGGPAHFHAGANVDLSTGQPTGTARFGVPVFNLADSRDLMIKLSSMDVPVGDTELSGSFGLDGKVSFVGPIITPDITATIKDARFASRKFDAEVTGISTKFQITSLTPVSSPGGQKINLKTMRVQKIQMHDARIRMCVENPTTILIEQTHWGWGEHGLLQTTAFRWHAGSQDVDVDLMFENVNLKDLLDAFASGKMTGEGGLYGRIPVIIKPGTEQAVTLQEGFLFLKPGDHASIKVTDPAMLAKIKAMADNMTVGYPFFVQSRVEESIMGLADFDADNLSIVFFREDDDSKGTIQASGKGKGLSSTHIGLIPRISIPHLDVIVSEGFNYWYNWQSKQKAAPKPSPLDDMF